MSPKDELTELGRGGAAGQDADRVPELPPGSNRAQRLQAGTSVASEDTFDDEDEEEHVTADDAIVGRALRWSLAGFAIAGAIGWGAFLVLRPSEEPPPAPAISAPPPRQVAQTVDPPDIRFTDITAESGIDHVHENGAHGDKLLPESLGGGAIFFDYDGDGDPDIAFINGAPWPDTPQGADRAETSDTGDARSPGPPPSQVRLYANDGAGNFTEVTDSVGLAGLEGYGMGGAVGDYDGDGWVDLYVTALGPNRLLRNVGGRFEDVTVASGAAGNSDDWSTAAAFIDVDNDADLDLFVGNYVVWSRAIDFEVDYRLTGVGRAYGPPQNFEGTYTLLLRNDGNGSFTDVSLQAGIQIDNPATGNPMGKALGLAPIDFDVDGYIDIFVANDTVRNYLFLNGRDGTFEEVGTLYGVAYDRNGNVTGAMGADAANLRNDDDIALIIGNFANEMTSLYFSQGDPSVFVDEAIGEGIGAPSRLALTFGVFAFDADLDGRLDVLQANGHLEEEISQVDPSQRYEQPAQLFWNAGPEARAPLIEVAADKIGDLAAPAVGRGATYADIDGDGDLDVLIAQVGRPARLLRNDQSTGNSWLRVRLADGPPDPPQVIGAWVEVTVGGVTQRRQVMPTRSYLSQVELPVTFGLDGARSADRVRIAWPDGAIQEITDVPANRELLVRREDAES